jgi:hypothetical protein
LSSAWSSITNRRGRTRAIWRQSSDRSAGAGDEDDPVAQVGPDPVELDDDRVATEDVLDLNVAELPVELNPAAQQLEHRRQRPHPDPALAAGGDDLAADHPRSRGDRDHDFVGLGLVEDLLDPLGGPEDPESERPHSLLAGVVVDEPDRGRAEVRVEMELADDHLAAGAGPDHQHLVFGHEVAVARALDDQPHGEAGAGDQEQGQHEVDHRDRARKVVFERLQDGEEDDQDGARRRHRADDHQEVAAAHVAPPLLVQAERGEYGELADHDEGDSLREEDLVAVRQPAWVVEEPEAEGEVERERDEDAVGGELEEAGAVDGVVEAAHRGCDGTEGFRAWLRGESSCYPATRLQSRLPACSPSPASPTSSSTRSSTPGPISSAAPACRRFSS